MFAEHLLKVHSKTEPFGNTQRILNLLFLLGWVVDPEVVPLTYPPNRRAEVAKPLGHLCPVQVCPPIALLLNCHLSGKYFLLLKCLICCMQTGVPSTGNLSYAEGEFQFHDENILLPSVIQLGLSVLQLTLKLLIVMNRQVVK